MSLLRIPSDYVQGIFFYCEMLQQHMTDFASFSLRDPAGGGGGLATAIPPSDSTVISI